MTELLSLTAPELDAIARAAELRTPWFRDRLAGPLTCELQAQPWFLRHRIVEVQSSTPFPARRIHVALGPAGPTVLTGDDRSLADVVLSDPPPPFTSLESIRDYALNCDFWTTAHTLGELTLRAWEDIPFFPNLSPEELALIGALKATVGHDMKPPSVFRNDTGDGFLVERWVLAEQKFIRRDLNVGKDGTFSRTDVVIDAQLPVPPGRVWRVVDGRFIPVG